jgi:tRNA A-37 threonylcarbamoyl transferase component Bud32
MPGGILIGLIAIACGARTIFVRLEKTPPVWIRLTPKVIHFAPVWSIEILNRREREWSDVRAMYLTGFEGTKFLSTIKWSSLNYATATPQLQIIFQSGGSAHIKLPLLRRDQAAELLTGISQFVQSKILSSDVIKLKEALLCESSTATYTELWAQDLEMRHGSTHFAPLSAGSTLADGRYKVLSELGTGGLSAIYLVESEDGRKLILKESVLPLDMQEQAKSKAREMFRREALILMKLSHPQIAKILDQFVQDGRDYIVSEFISGKTLRQLVAKEGRRPEKDVLGWAREIADILVYLHHQSPPVVHRDVTPDNILFRDDGTLVLIDFGAANEYLGAATGTMVGKQAYIPPEQLRGKYEPASDLYGLGATMYFLLTGKDPLPLDCSHPKEVVASLSDQIDALVAAATELEVEDRVATAETMLEKIRSLFA